MRANKSREVDEIRRQNHHNKHGDDHYSRNTNHVTGHAIFPNAEFGDPERVGVAVVQVEFLLDGPAGEFGIFQTPVGRN